MSTTVGAWDRSGRLSSLGVVWVLGLAGMGIAYAIMETTENVELLGLGAAMAFLAGPFFLVTFAIRALWPLIQGRISGLAALWALGAGGIGLALLAEGKAGPELTRSLLLRRGIVLLGPFFLAGVTLVWLLDRRGRRRS